MLTAAAGLGLLSSSCGTSVAPTAEVQAAAPPASSQVWVDPETHLTWAAKDNGYPVDWNQATTFCQNLRAGGYKDWMLPTIDQLEKIYWVGENDYGHPVKGNIKLTSDWEWSSTKNGSGAAWGFGFGPGKRNSDDLDHYGVSGRALCVRRAE